MKIFYILTFLLISQASVFAQSLAFNELGFDPAFCRLFNYQNGNGVVYASATGGTPPYSYNWEHLSSGTSTSNSLWGGLNPGEYVITITDDVGAVITDTITLDSLNPVAAISIVSSGLTQSGDHYYGAGPIQVEFANNSLYFANPNDPNADTTFFWRMTQFSSWYISHVSSDIETYDYNYGGDWGVYLVALNKNGCSDTTMIHLHLSGTAGMDENSEQQFNVSFNSIAQQVCVQSQQQLNGELIRIYNLSGQLIHSEVLTTNQTILKVNFAAGVYVYEIVNPKSETCFETGKFVVN